MVAMVLCELLFTPFWEKFSLVQVFTHLHSHMNTVCNYLDEPHLPEHLIVVQAYLI